jgi:4-amino-4-deoxy-L-arabinose transferase-like glycosyltransferase
VSRDRLRGRGRRSVLAAAALLGLWFALTIGWRALALPDEGRYVGVAWEMTRAHDWSVPTLAGLPYFHKPPLFYWLTAVAIEVGGTQPGALRFASWLSATAAAAALYAFMRHWSGETRARAAALVLATTPLFYGAAQYANLDMLVAGCITLSVLAFAHAVLQPPGAQGTRAAHRAAVAGHAAAALGVLAKGLIGVVLPWLVIGLWTLAIGRRRAWARLAWWPGPLLFAAVALPWFVAMQWQFPAFADYFFVEQHLRRFSGAGFNNPQPPWFFAVALPLLLLPWTPWAWAACRPPFWRERTGRPLRLLLLLWAGVVVIFFSVPQSKLIGYVLPAVPPLAALGAEAFFALRAGSSRVVPRLWAFSAVVALSLMPLLAALAARYQAPGSADVAQVLARERRPHERVVLLDRYPFDLALLARVDDAWIVIDDWRASEIAERDDWRRELVDAARFAPAERRTERLVNRAALGPRLCGSHDAWFVAARDAVPAGLAARTPTHRGARWWLWRLQATDWVELTGPTGCPQTPNDDPAHR